MQIGQEIRNETTYGLRVDVTIEQIKEDKPLIYTYTYMLNTLKFKEWLESKEIVPLCEGPFAFTGRGIQFMIYGGAAKWDKTAFSIEDENGEKCFLKLAHEEIRFIVHRDLFAGEEWDVLVEDSVVEPLAKEWQASDEDDVPF